MSMDNTNRFSNRVENYVKYRPGYPAGVVDYLQHTFGLTSDKVIADIGAGTGISSELFLKNHHTVFAVEPNKAMRDKAVHLLGSYAGFHAVDGTAEHTTLPGASVDVILAGQAFHWFDRRKAKEEFRRIMKPDGIVVLMWNERNTTSEFEKRYDELIISHSKDYVKVDHRNIDEQAIITFFQPLPVTTAVFSNHQVFDFQGLRGRLLSSSYIPAIGEPGHDQLMQEVRQLFDQYQQDNLIRINYTVNVYIGKL